MSEVKGRIASKQELKGRITAIPQVDKTLTKDGYAADAKATGDRIKGLTASDVGARPNTWLPAIAEIGAAPSGYGLGENNGRYCADCHGVTKGGLYYINYNTANKPDGVNGGSMFVQPIATDDGTDIYVELKSGASVIKCYYSSWGKAWQPWEWVNPPMTLGVEYRTTERWNGKTVYTVLVDCGTVVAGENTISTTFACSAVIGSRGQAGSGAIPQTYESARSDKYFKACNVSRVSGKIYITLLMGTSQSATSPCHIQVWYTKD